MNDTATKMPTTTLLDHLAGVTKGELTVVPPAPPSPTELAVRIRQGHREVEAHAVHAVVKAVETGKDLIAAKAVVGHGNFEDYVASECRFKMSTAQNYMKMTRHEDEVRQMVAAKAQGGGYLTLSQALKLINTLSRKNRRKKRPPA